MKISKSKQELARIISENGGWREMAKFSAQDKDGDVYHFATKPTINAGHEAWHHKGCIGEGEFTAETLPNWHQTILSREEYFFLHQNQGLEDALDEPMVEAKPTIEQLASDYRNAKDYAERKQQEVGAAKADVEARLKALELAGEAIGLLVSPITAKQEPELAITDWRDLQTGDLVWAEEEVGRVAEGEYEVLEVEVPDYDGKRTIRIRGGEGGQFWINYENGWRFIRRP